MKHTMLMAALVILVMTCLATLAFAEERGVGYPPIWYRSTGARDVTGDKNLHRRGWISDTWESVKEEAKKVEEKIEAGIEKVREDAKEAWNNFIDDLRIHGRDAPSYDVSAAERGADGSPSLARRDWLSNAWEAVKEGAQEIGEKIDAGIEKVEEDVKEAWEKFLDDLHVHGWPLDSRDDSKAERDADGRNSVEKRVYPPNDFQWPDRPGWGYPVPVRRSAEKRIYLPEEYLWPHKGWPDIYIRRGVDGKRIIEPPYYYREWPWKQEPWKDIVFRRRSGAKRVVDPPGFYVWPDRHKFWGPGDIYFRRANKADSNEERDLDQSAEKRVYPPWKLYTIPP